MMEIGTRIKALRLSHSMTQAQLAEKLGVSVQAVSKWESKTNMPDIQLLPELSVIFGVSIDSLFNMTDARRMDRIENSLENTRFLSAEEFVQQEKYLLDRRSSHTQGDRATLLLAMLYNKRADEYHELAKPLAREALIRNPERKDAHHAILEAERGPYLDWNFTNHHDLIIFYKEIVETHPEDLCNYFWLLDLLIADCRTVEARHYTEKMRNVAYTFHYEMYMGYICQAECNLPDALDWWRKMTDAWAENWNVWAEYGSILAKLARYDEAEAIYRKCMPMRPRPRFTDCEDALTQLCLLRGDIDGAIEMQRQMLSVVQEDWTTEGELVDHILREIKRLETMK